MFNELPEKEKSSFLLKFQPHSSVYCDKSIIYILVTETSGIFGNKNDVVLTGGSLTLGQQWKYFH